MENQDALLQAVSALSGYFLGDATMKETLTRVSELARSVVPGAEQVGLTLVVDGNPGTYVFTDPEIPNIDQQQYETGDGPCLDAWRTGRPTLLPTTRSSTEYVAFCRVARQYGILSVLSLPLSTPSGRIGAMNMYATREQAFGPAEVEIGQRFADQAAFLLVNAQAYWDARTLSENLQEAMKSRSVIEQAKGIIMGALGCSEDDAFSELRRQSQHENVKLRDLAAQIVRSAHRPR